MPHELELNKLNRLKMAQAFQNNKRVDYSIDCVIEGQMGRAFVDDLHRPTAYRITIGPFWYLAGEARSEGGCQMLKDFPANALLMPSPDPWLEAAQEVHGGCLQPFTRYSFSASSLSTKHLANILKGSRYKDRIVPIGLDLAVKLAAQAESCFEISEFDSAQDFAERGRGYAVTYGDQVMGVAYSSLVCSKGIEVSIYIDEPYRRQGVATALGSKLLLDCLVKGLRPNWDAANPESCKLAMRLGYTFVEAYDAYFLRT